MRGSWVTTRNVVPDCRPNVSVPARMTRPEASERAGADALSVFAKPTFSSAPLPALLAV
jgi:hypothetical protein